MLRLIEVNDEGSSLDFAVFTGEQGSYNYHPKDEKHKKAYASGLGKWLDWTGITGVNTFDLADPATMQGFVYTLVANKRLVINLDPSAKDIDWNKVKNYQSKVMEDLLETILGQYDSLGRIIPEILEEKEKFQKGIRIAQGYLREELSTDLLWLSCYGLDAENLSDSKIRRYKQIHDDMDNEITKTLNELGENENTIQAEFLAYMRLYERKKVERDNSLANGNNMATRKHHEYMELILRYLVNDNVLSLSEDGEGIVRKSFAGSGCAELMKEYDVIGKLNEISRLRMN